MKRVLFKILNYLIVSSLAIVFTGCLDDFLHPIPKCTDSKVVNRLDALLDANSIYGSDAKLNEALIVMVGVNEETNMKTCKARVDYSLKNENNNTIVNMVNNIPFMSDIAKNREVTYTISHSKDKKDFIVEIVD